MKREACPDTQYVNNSAVARNLLNGSRAWK
jgi:hypothetical protein